jgi:hypothetical protein
MNIVRKNCRWQPVSACLALTASGLFSPLGPLLSPSASAQPAESIITTTIPYDVTHDPEDIRQMVHDNKVPEAHRLFGLMAWRAFVALNWPTPDEKTKSRDMSDNVSWRAWNYWRSAETIFLPDGAKPAPWSGELHHSKGIQSIPNNMNRAYNPNQSLEAFTGPLVDQNGKWAHFDIRVNREEYDYIRDNGLYSLNGQVAFSNKEHNNEVRFPLNDGEDRHGAVEIKLAWKEIGINDDTNRFYTKTIQVTRAEVQPYTTNILVGLVGMHIAMRTRSSPEWIWSTFEQIDNVRSNPDPATGKPNHPNFFNPSLITTNVNVLPARNAWLDPNTRQLSLPGTNTPNSWIESRTTNPVQATRLVVPFQTNLNPWDQALGKVTAALNVEAQAQLRAQSSVFQYYELIDTQWPLHPNFPAFAGGNGSAPESVRFKTPGQMVPVFLINTTMETFFQNGDQPAGGTEQDDRIGDNAIIDSTRVFATESCVGCHYSSGIATGFKKNGDGAIQLDMTTRKPVPIYGENNHFGKTGGANFSWMLQLEPFASNGAPAALPYDAGLPASNP